MLLKSVGVIRWLIAIDWTLGVGSVVKNDPLALCSGAWGTNESFSGRVKEVTYLNSRVLIRVYITACVRGQNLGGVQGLVGENKRPTLLVLMAFRACAAHPEVVLVGLVEVEFRAGSK